MAVLKKLNLCQLKAAIIVCLLESFPLLVREAIVESSSEGSSFRLMIAATGSSSDYFSISIDIYACICMFLQTHSCLSLEVWGSRYHDLDGPGPQKFFYNLI